MRVLRVLEVTMRDGNPKISELFSFVVSNCFRSDYEAWKLARLLERHIRSFVGF